MTRRKDPFKKKASPLTLFIRLVVLLAVVVSCLVATGMLYVSWRGVSAGGVRIEGGNPDLNPGQRVYLQVVLSLNAEALDAPAGSALAPVNFTIQPGETAVTIANNLHDVGLLDNPELFLDYAHYYGLDSQLEAGEFTLSPEWTIPKLALTLTKAIAQDVELRFIEGWRLEEMAHALSVTQPAQINPDEFLAIVTRERPFDLTPYTFLVGLPADASLEGFLFPDTYRLPLDADAAYLVDKMLTRFGEQVTPTLRQGFGTQGLSLLEAVTLASIVQREAVLAEERPLIAGVFLNRLAADMTLSADPTVQYAVGYDSGSDSWWKVPLYVSDLEYDSPYNTYVYTGLPPGPIAAPSLSALQAVANPAPSDFLFFVADCTADTAGAHYFSVTFDEHLAKVQSCQ
ncbi:MAG: aminodeoxychorismate lyase [Chloroflexi bacterium]|nr:MAG: aminodeoxychorismate lyase [Chloroflexota bacterium]PIE81236.1 MAG: aminodeoxychorismate lyase [Chloroflexota bacterium]